MDIRTILPYIIFVILATLILNISVNVFNITSDIFLKIPIAKLLSCALSYIIAYIFYKLCVRFNVNITIIESLKKQNKLVLIINVTIGIIAIATESYLLTIYSNIIPIPATITGILVNAALVLLCTIILSAKPPKVLNWIISTR